MTGITADEVLRGINLAINEFKDLKIQPPFEYMVNDFSRRVVSFVFSTMSRHHEWFGIRK